MKVGAGVEVAAGVCSGDTVSIPLVGAEVGVAVAVAIAVDVAVAVAVNVGSTTVMTPCGVMIGRGDGAAVEIGAGSGAQATRRIKTLTSSEKQK